MKKVGAYLPGAYEEVVDVVDAYVLTEKVWLCSAKNKDQKLIGRFSEDGMFYRLMTAVPLKMYGKFGLPK